MLGPSSYGKRVVESVGDGFGGYTPDVAEIVELEKMVLALERKDRRLQATLYLIASRSF
ncbi:hypothetical protein [Rhizobium leguminosarum]|uniref:hypothetical protein n=1 Tax=Rhizobium TaxID=379 RepID=UPI0013E2C63F|nr:hypothetical protein [Rhizobium leguminosarum]